MIKKTVKYIDIVITAFEDWTLFITVIAALIAMFANVVLRYGFNNSLPWSEELVRNAIVYTTFIGCSAAVKQRSMIKIDALIQFFPIFRIPLNIFSSLSIIVFASMITYYGYEMAQRMIQTHQKTIILQIPLVYIYAVLPLMGILMILRTFILMYQEFTGLQIK